MRSGVTAREKERAERATLVQQEKLSKAKVLRSLPPLSVYIARCALTDCAQQGSAECWQDKQENLSKGKGPASCTRLPPLSCAHTSAGQAVRT